MDVLRAQAGPEAQVLALKAWIHKGVVRCWVPPADVDDVVQEITLAAIVAIRAGRYNPPSGSSPRRALLAWLTAVARYQLGHYWQKAHRRREIPAADPWSGAEPEGPSIEAQLDARRTLARIDDLPPPLRPIALLAAQGYGLTGIAWILDRPVTTTQNQLRAVRLALGAIRPPRNVR